MGCSLRVGYRHILVSLNADLLARFQSHPSLLSVANALLSSCSEALVAIWVGYAVTNRSCAPVKKGKVRGAFELLAAELSRSDSRVIGPGLLP